MGLFIATPSYNGEITFNVTSTREIVPDMEFFIECIETSLGSLMAAAAPKKKTVRKKTAKKTAGGKKKKASKKTPAA